MGVAYQDVCDQHTQYYIRRLCRAMAEADGVETKRLLSKLNGNQAINPNKKSPKLRRRA